MNWHQSISDDLDSIISETFLFESFRNKRVTLLGGSGFIGKWILSSFIHANEHLQTNIDISVISTDESKLKFAYAEKTKTFTFLDLDLSKVTASYYLPESDFFLHAATSTNPSVHFKHRQNILRVAENSSRVVIESARKFQNVPRVVHLSSGIVYPKLVNLLHATPEADIASKTATEPTYKGAKILIERMVSESVAAGEIQGSNPRLFAFSGPGIPVDAHFAVGNFMQDALLGKSIKITGNPDTLRSYMYPTDLVSWLLTILETPRDIPINVGSNIPVSLNLLAKKIANLRNPLHTEVTESFGPPDSYFPITDTASKVYGLQMKVALEDGLERWMKFLQS
jgi:nucleoside-diphosphate-sugar epimerase